MFVQEQVPEVGKKKDPGQRKERRIELRAEELWAQRVERQAERFNLGLSAYIRQAIQERLERDEATDPREEGGE